MRHCRLLFVVSLLLTAFLSESISQVPAENRKVRKPAVASATKDVKKTASSYSYRTKQSGNWNNSNTWEYWDGSNGCRIVGIHQKIHLLEEDHFHEVGFGFSVSSSGE